MNNIFKRQSIRKYLDKPVEKEKIELLLKAGMQAPSAANQQPWEFLVITDKEKLQALSEMSPYAKPLADCGVAFVLLGNLETAHFPQYWQQDMAAAAENILLEATDLDLGGVWLGVAPENDRMNHITRVCELPDNIKPFCLLSIGYPDEQRTIIERYDASRVHYEKY
ncbi:nitroreductase family protein [Acetobacterium bakii]|uniref:Nitroreductase n=1 Tax=Acetobacterium bakii TaxID=52689 RepID=A0A0L6U0F6_9FIRM|nr:nitroreductase family protein [Acetobacterium bakii]KNZ41822.1 nitroreductase [Acetobacterium bakii]